MCPEATDAILPSDGFSRVLIVAPMDIDKNATCAHDCVACFEKPALLVPPLLKRNVSDRSVGHMCPEAKDAMLPSDGFCADPRHPEAHPQGS